MFIPAYDNIPAHNYYKGGLNQAQCDIASEYMWIPAHNGMHAYCAWVGSTENTAEGRGYINPALKYRTSRC
jgi:hypothetical protein